MILGNCTEFFVLLQGCTRDGKIDVDTVEREGT